MRTFSFCVGLLFCAGVVSAQAKTSAGKVDFEKHVLPIFENSCFKCHKGPYKDKRGKVRKPKAGLRLDGAGWILRGTDEARVLVPGQPAESSIFLRTTLDEDDEDIMPASGTPLTKEQQSLLRRWIEQGAEFGSWSGTGGPGMPTAGSDAASLKMLRTLAKGMKPALPAAVKKASSKHCRVQPVVPGSPLLRVDFVSHESKVNDATVEPLAALTGHITHMRLGRTQISDASMAVVAKMSKLTHLDLHKTSISDRGIAALTNLQELRYLNLYGTKVTDEALKHLARLRKLEAVYIWQTKVTTEGVASLQELLPKTRISHKMDLPVVPANEGNRGRRGRRPGAKKKK